MARRQFPQHNLPRTFWGRISGAADVWYSHTAGVIVGEDYFEASSVGTIAAQPIATGAPTVTGGITQVHVVAADPITTGAPSVSGAIVQLANLGAAPITTGAPIVTAGGIAQVHVLAAAVIATSAPRIGAGLNSVTATEVPGPGSPIGSVNDSVIVASNRRRRRNRNKILALMMAA